jgi:hypothetical protein
MAPIEALDLNRSVLRRKAASFRPQGTTLSSIHASFVKITFYWLHLCVAPWIAEIGPLEVQTQGPPGDRRCTSLRVL